MGSSKKNNKRKKVRTRQTRRIKERQMIKKSKRRGGGGGDIIEIDLRQILLTNPIKDAVKEISGNDDFDFSGFKTARDNHGFKLHKIENMMGIEDFGALLEEEPVVVKNVLVNGRPSGIKIDGVMKPLYEIVDGRHRFARAIIEDMTTIRVKNQL